MTLWLNGVAAQAQQKQLRYRWIYVSQNLMVDANVRGVQDLLRRAAAAGYNGVLLADYKFNVLDRVTANYARNVAAVKQTAQELKLELIPAVCPIGYSSGLLAHDPNLAEGIPVRDAPFAVHGRQADLVPSSAMFLRNGSFERAQNNRLTGWDMQDSPGIGSFVDTAVTHDGHASSLRLENIGAADPQNGHGRIMQKVAVTPYRQMHLSVWIKTEGFDTPEAVNALALTASGRSLAPLAWTIARTQGWTQYHAVFNTLDNHEILLYLGVWGGKRGKIWFDDARLEEVGLLNVLRRPGCPVTVRGEDGTLYEEGRDYEPIRDEHMGNVPYDGEYEVYHPAPPIRLTASGSRLKEGQTVRVSYYHPVLVYGSQVTCCLSEPKVYEVLKEQITGVQQLLAPSGFMLSHDEMRVANWCAACEARNLTPGQLLADNVRRCVGLIRAVNPQATLFIWSDMFDPYHNAVDSYYLVNGNLAGSWEGLPKETVIVNWNYDRRKKSLPWFAAKGYPQILAGYYDGPVDSIHGWLEDAKAVPGIEIAGVMYTTWQNRYADLEAFARAAWGDKVVGAGAKR